jgi:hypothetical protein
MVTLLGVYCQMNQELDKLVYLLVVLGSIFFYSIVKKIAKKDHEDSLVVLHSYEYLTPLYGFLS